MLILWILMGTLCGWIAALLSRTSTSINLGFYMTIGIIGLLIGGLITQIFSSNSIFFNPISLFTAILASGVLLTITRLFLRNA